MSLRKVQHVQGEFYHIYNRGNSKQKIFNSDEDYERFINLLYLANGSVSLDLRLIKESATEPFQFVKGEPQVAIGAYCLMPNHFHILITPFSDTGMANFMKKLATAYSMFFNTKYHRTGTLFEGRYKSEHVNEDRYLKYLFAYIHLNPIKLIQSDWREVGLHNAVNAQSFLSSYLYSSHLDNIIVRPELAILNRNHFPIYFDSSSDINKEMLEWLTNYEHNTAHNKKAK